MPELPEVEFARRCLERWLVGLTLAKVTAGKTRVLREASVARLEELAGRRVRAIDRKGKQLLWRLDDGAGLLAHLGMTGKFVRVAKGADDPRWSRARFERDDGASVHLVDQRLFGLLVPGRIEDLERSSRWTGLGADAWNEPPSPAALRALVSARRTSIKDALMDQKLLAGLGNIQVTEALWRARIDPRRRADSLDTNEAARLVRAIRWTLERTLDSMQGDEVTYVEEDPSQNPFRIYARADEPCPRCGATLSKTVIGGRTTAFCPGCQS